MQRWADWFYGTSPQKLISATMTAMRALVVILAVVGSLTGAVVGVIAHHASSQSMGWTLYAPPPPRRYADYLPAAHTSWFPGIVEYVGIGLAAGLIVAAALAALRFRLVRVPRAT